MTEVDDILEHHGVKGMHWGVRTSGSTGKASAKKTLSEDAAKASEIRKKAKKGGSQSLSNDEMRTLIQRMQLDSQFSQLNAKQKNKGLQKAKQILDNVGTQIVTQEIKTGGKGTRGLITLGKAKYSQTLFEDIMKEMSG